MRRNLFELLAAATLAASIFLIESSVAVTLKKSTKNDPFTIERDVIYLPDSTREEKADLYIPKPSRDARKD